MGFRVLCVPLRPLRLKPPVLQNSDTPRSGSNKQLQSGAARCRTPVADAPWARPYQRLGNAFGNGREVGGRAARAPAKRRFPHSVLTNRHGVRHPVRKKWWGYGLVFDRIYRINRIEGRQEERGRRGNHAESAEGKGNSDGWQGYANAPPFLKVE